MTAASAQLRRAGPSDLDRLTAFEQIVFTDEPNRIHRRQWSYLLARTSGEVTLVEAEGRLLAVMVLTLSPGGRALRIYSLGIHPRARRRGLARRLVEHAIAFARRRRLPEVRLEVRATNAAAVRLYRQQGFEVARILPSYYGLGEDGWRMARAIAAEGS